MNLSMLASLGTVRVHVPHDSAGTIARPWDLREWVDGEIVSVTVSDIADDAAPLPAFAGWTKIVVSDDAVRYERA